ncbi:hypothetical protein QE152_g7084 [Popillia japonica]|uniref:Uncharacterized protein n=1 Tax=Popillia japonica TaxID=7064 RepID=A0AAW1MGH5_POPJA
MRDEAVRLKTGYITNATAIVRVGSDGLLIFKVTNQLVHRYILQALPIFMAEERLVDVGAETWVLSQLQGHH